MGERMSKWRCTYKGRPDQYSKEGCASPSWHSFDLRSWEKGRCRVQLTNLSNQSRKSGLPVEYWLTIDKNGQERMVTRYAVIVFKPDEVPCKIVGSDWQQLVREGKQIADGELTFEQWMHDACDDEILKVLCRDPWKSIGAYLSDIERGLTRNLWKPDRKLIRSRIKWLADHGFVHHHGGVGGTTRWIIAS
jgi:hypothetical protein